MGNRGPWYRRPWRLLLDKFITLQLPSCKHGRRAPVWGRLLRLRIPQRTDHVIHSRTAEEGYPGTHYVGGGWTELSVCPLCWATIGVNNRKSIQIFCDQQNATAQTDKSYKSSLALKVRDIDTHLLSSFQDRARRRPARLPLGWGHPVIGSMAKMFNLFVCLFFLKGSRDIFDVVIIYCVLCQ